MAIISVTIEVPNGASCLFDSGAYCPAFIEREGMYDMYSICIAFPDKNSRSTTIAYKNGKPYKCKSCSMAIRG